MWLIFSGFSKLGMIIGSKVIWPNILALATWVIFVTVAIAVAFGTPASNNQSTQLDNIVIPIILFGWPIVDIIDAALLQPAKVEMK
jgi:ABC-type dipeptide/oligopeptide/nickel transport system permease component